MAPNLPRIIALAAAISVPAAYGAFEDPLDKPAQLSPLATSRPLFGITAAGTRLVAVGQRGHVLVSDDGGQDWQQAAVPTSTDLTAVQFVTDKKGWAVGHDGLVLTSDDAGATWKKQLDGRQIGPLLVSFYEKAPVEEEKREGLLSEARFFLESGPDKPFLDVFFENEREGFVIGSFNLILRTADGGQTWTPWQDRMDNPRILNLHAIRSIGGEIYVVGELGIMLKLDRAAQRFVALPSPYAGSYFGVTGKPDVVIAYGMRGNVFTSRDQGSTWHKVDTGLEVGITGATVLSDGRVAIVSQLGHLLICDDAVASCRAVAGAQHKPAAGVAESHGGGLVLVGVQGAHREKLN